MKPSGLTVNWSQFATGQNRTPKSAGKRLRSGLEGFAGLGALLTIHSSCLAQKPDNAEPVWHANAIPACERILRQYPVRHLVVGIGDQTVTCRFDPGSPVVFLPMKLEDWRRYQN
jgi:hypothetical protein